jgi:hypothetical protein
MAGTITETHTKRGPIGLVTLSFTADAADGSLPSTNLATKISGNIVALETNPGATAPTDNYDIVVNDADGHDVLEGVGANRDTATTEKVAVVYSGTAIHPPVSIEDVLSLVITNNSVNSAVGTVKIYYVGEGS